MRNWLYLHSRAFAQALRRLAVQPLGTLLSALVMGIALALPAGGYLLLDNVAALARGVSGTPEISLFLENNATAVQIGTIGRKLDAEPEVAGHRFVSRDEALKQLANSGLGEVLDGIAANPLPDAFVVTLRGEDPALFDEFSRQMQNWSGVAHVQLDSAWVRRLAALLELGRAIVFVLAALLGFALVIVTFNTIRLQILTQKNEIEVSRLLGATGRFISRPFYWFGSLQGALGGLIALGAVWAGVATLAAPVAKVAGAYGVIAALSGPGWKESLVLIASAVVLGWLGAAISAWRHLAET